jgi:hypothetical protein
MSVARGLALVPPDKAVPSEWVALARRASESHPGSWQHRQVLGATLYRAGRAEEGVRELEEAARLHDKGGSLWTRLFLALAHRRLGHTEQARTWTAKTAWTGGDSEEWLIYRQLAQERRALSEAALGLAGTASHVWPTDPVDALYDGVFPTRSGDGSIPRFTWWDHKWSTEWVQYDFPKPRVVSSAEAYWFGGGNGPLQVPQSWRLLYRDGDAWKPVEAATPYGLKLDAFNKVTFKPVRVTALRLEAQLRKGFSAGILEWRVGP